jgi:HEAT repeat protein
MEGRVKKAFKVEQDFMRLFTRYSRLLSAVVLCAWAGVVLCGTGLRSIPARAYSTAPEGSRVDSVVVSTLRRLLKSPQSDVRASALEWIASDAKAQSTEFIPQIFAALKDRDGKVQDKALSNMGWILDRYHGSAPGVAALAAIQRALNQPSDRTAQLVALDLIGGPGGGGVYANAGASRGDVFLLSDPSIRKMLVSMLANPQSSLRPQLLRLMGGSHLLWSAPGLVGAVGAALQDDDLNVRNAAIHLLVKMDKQAPKSLQAQIKTELKDALKTGDPNVQLQASRALGVPAPPPQVQARLVSLAGEKVSMAGVPFDFNYFTAFVQPLFVKKYGSASCVQCHTPESNSSGKFRILAPGPEGRYTIQQSRVNFVSVLNVIDRQDPMKSRLLLKPLDPTTREGTIHGMNHDGGVFWHDQFDSDFEIVAAWLKGAKLEDDPQKQLDFAYFMKHVEPIFSTPGPDGFACINCHSTHAILHLESPETSNGKFSVAQIVNNYQSALRVVDETAPSDSYIVRKPTSPREGVPGGLSHAGGIRWPALKQSWQYRTLIAWMGMPNLEKNPEKLTSATAHGSASP